MSHSSTKLHQLEGLRGIAAFMVVLSHLRLTFFVDAEQVITSHWGSTAAVFFEAIIDGNFAVWLFWVMSALVLSLRFHMSSDASACSTMLTDAAIRRYPRLLVPVMASVLFAWILHQAGLMSNVQLENLLGPKYDEWLGSFYLFEPNGIAALKSAAWEAFFAYELSSSYNSALWTMEPELYGSLFLFAYLALAGKHSARWLIYLVTIGIVCCLSIHWINAFVIGAMICDWFVNRDALRKFFPDVLGRYATCLVHHQGIAVLSILPMMFLIGLTNLGGVLHLLLASMLTAYVVVSRPAGNLFSRKLPVFLGKISFGLYLAHTPIICAVAYPVYSNLLGLFSPWFAAIVASILLIGLSLLSGWVMWFIADRPAIAFARKVAHVLKPRTPKS